MQIGRRLSLSYILMAGLVFLLVFGANVLTGRIKQEFEGLSIQTTRLIPALESLRFTASEITASLVEHLLFSSLHEWPLGEKRRQSTNCGRWRRKNCATSMKTSRHT